MRSEGDTLKEPKGSVFFATQNKGKFLEASRVAAAYGIRLKQLNMPKQEIQADRLEDIAAFAAKTAAQTCGHPVLSEDAGLFVDALGGFPGPYSSYVFKTIGNVGILKLMQAVKKRNAHFSATVAYCKPNGRPLYFTGTVHGLVSRRRKGSQGFGFDPIFVPTEGGGRTFAEMNTGEKNAFSHRAKAFAKFSRWFAAKPRPRAA